LPLDLEFATKGQLATAIVGDAVADGVPVDFICRDEVYGSCTRLRDYLEEQGQAYVLRVPSSFRVPLARGLALTVRCRALAEVDDLPVSGWLVPGKPVGKGATRVDARSPLDGWLVSSGDRPGRA
jgi:hypothetical protein